MYILYIIVLKIKLITNLHALSVAIHVPPKLDLRSIIMFMCHILRLNVAKMHLPIEVPFYGMRFQKILRSVNL